MMGWWKRYRSMKHALTLIAGDSCEKSTARSSWCPSQRNLRPDALYGVERWCDACTARVGLKGGFG